MESRLVADEVPPRHLSDDGEDNEGGSGAEAERDAGLDAGQVTGGQPTAVFLPPRYSFVAIVKVVSIAVCLAAPKLNASSGGGAATGPD